MTSYTTQQIAKLSSAKQHNIRSAYERRKLNTGSARALRLFGLHYLHVGRIRLRILYVISCFLYVGIIRYIVQAFMLNQMINKKNEQILEKAYNEFR